MKSNLDKGVLRFIESWVPIGLGVLEILVGLALVLFVSLTPLINMSLQPWLLNVLRDLGIGLLAAGIITASLEPISRRRMQRDIDEIRQVHFESMLKGLMPEPIFREVQAHIIGQPFLRKDFHLAIELSWVDEAREYIHMSQSVSYAVQNVSRTLEDYRLHTFEERVNEDAFPGCTHIDEIRVSLSGPEPVFYTGAHLEKFITVTDQFIEARIPVKLEPGQAATIATRTESVLASRDVYTYHMTKPTIQLDVTVAHPEDLAVRAAPMHPSRNAFVVEVEVPTLKRWRIEAGLLPFQGVQLSWRPI